MILATVDATLTMNLAVVNAAMSNTTVDAILIFILTTVEGSFSQNLSCHEQWRFYNLSFHECSF